MQLLTVAAALDALHHQVLCRDKGQIGHDGLVDDVGVDKNIRGDLLHDTQYRVGTEEALGDRYTAVGAVVEGALHPLDGYGHRRVQRVSHEITRQRANALAHHRITLIGHRGGADLCFRERLKELTVVLQQAHIGGEFMRGLRDRGQRVEDTRIELARIGLTLYVKDLVKAERVGDPAVEGVDLVAVAVKQLHKARLRACRAAASEELDVFDREIDLVEVRHEVLQP